MRKSNICDQHKLLIKGLVAAVFFILLAVFVSITSAVVVLLFMLAFFFRVDPAVPLAVTMIMLVLCGGMLLIDQAGTAIVLANWAYFFFAVGVSLLVYGHIRMSWNKEDDMA